MPNEVEIVAVSLRIKALGDVTVSRRMTLR